MVDIAGDGSDDRGYLFKTANDVDVSDVSGMPDFVAAGEVERIAVVPAAVGIRKYSDFFH